MAKFEVANNLTAVNEGGYSGHQDDNGNWTGGKKGVGMLIGTKFGISAPVLMDYLGRVPTVTEMRNLTKSISDSIYMAKYWQPIRGNEIESQEIANGIYDMAVNAGVGTAIILAKRARNFPETSKMDDYFLKTLNQNI